jgi:uncharacterized protein (DUF302 family)
MLPERAGRAARSALLAVALICAAPARGGDRVEQSSERGFEDTVERLEWVLGGYGVTTVAALDYQQIFKNDHPGPRAATLEVMRREWAKALLSEDPALGAVLPVRIYVFERPGGPTVVSYERIAASLEGHPREPVRAFGRRLDDKLRAIVSQATAKPGEQK